MKNRLKINIDDKKFVHQNFEKLVDKYGGSTIVIANGEVFSGPDASRRARQKYPRLNPFVLPLPKPEFFTHHFVL